VKRREGKRGESEVIEVKRAILPNEIVLDGGNNASSVCFHGGSCPGDDCNADTGGGDGCPADSGCGQDC